MNATTNVARPRRRGTWNRRGFTLAEAIVVIVILGVLATLIVPRVLQRVGQSKQGVAKSNASTLFNRVKEFSLDCGYLPDGPGLDFLWERPSEADASAWQGPYLDKRDQLMDPWKRPYILRIPPLEAADFEIVSYGADGQPGGEGEDEDIVAP